MTRDFPNDVIIFPDREEDNIRIKIRQMLASHDKEMQALGKTLQIEETRKKNLHLPLLKMIQIEYPMVIVGGTTGLYLNGIKLERHKSERSPDLDIIIPYYMKFENLRSLQFGEQWNNTYSKDYDYGMLCNDIPLDVRIDGKQKWEMIELDGFKYKVSLPEYAIEAKIRYIMKGGMKGVKHKNDLYEMLSIKKEEEQVVEITKYYGGS